MSWARVLLPVLLWVGVPGFGQGPSAPSGKAGTVASADNELLKQIVARDQAVRAVGTGVKTDQKIETDEDRRRLVRAMVERNDLHTGLDFANAALVFQHGAVPDDYLLAHALAVIGASKGNPLALWLTAATLDRYLQAVGRAQIYGTQFKRSGPGPFTMEPINSGLLTEKIKEETGVPSPTEQQNELKSLNEKIQSEPKK